MFASTTLTNEWLETNNIDLILSTVHFDSRKVPLVVVNPLLMKDDIIKINNQLDGIAMINRTGSKQNSGNEINAIEKMQKSI